MNQATTTQRQERTVFLSFTSLDREAARSVAEGLRAVDVDVWWDEGGIGWGDDWQSKLEQALSRCGAYLILLGSGGVRRWVKPELGVALRRHVDDGLPIMPLLLEGVSPETMPPFLSNFQARSLPPDLNAFDFGMLAQELTGALLPSEPESEDVCPFPGLATYDEDDARFFLGRQADTLALLQRLGPGLDGVRRRWLQVEGPSGVGKSSLVRAGLIPAVRNGWLEESNPGDWTVLTLRPGAKPLQTLAAGLERALAGKADAGMLVQRLDNLRKAERTDTDDLGYLLKVAVPESNRLLLVIDQFEELFTLTEEEKVRHRLDALLAAALEDPDCPLYLVTTVRSDFLLHFGDLPRLQMLLNERAGRYDLQPLGIEGLREVVRIPAQRAGLEWSEASLPKRIIDDAIGQRAPLPLVANLLRLLWDGAHKRGDRVLSADDYRQLKGVAGALARSADDLLESLGPDGKECARGLLLALVKPGRESQDTRRTVSVKEALKAAGDGKVARRVLDCLSGLRTAESGEPAPRLVVVTQTEGGGEDPAVDQVDLAHEALLRLDHKERPYWKTLRRWVDEERKMLQDRDLLEVLAEQWLEQGSPRLSGLATGRQRKDFSRITGARDPAPSYLRASRRRSRWMNSLWVFGLIAAVAVVNAWWLEKMNWTFQEEMSQTQLHLYLWSRWEGLLDEPEMIPIQGGTFQMGCVSGKTCQSDELPVHKVQVRPFAMGRTEVTFSQYDQFALATGRTLPKDEEGWGRGDRPVINVSWDDADAYAQWLQDETRKPYRLPTEAEWEYAARAETETPFSTGDCIHTDQANYDGNDDYEECGAKTGVYRGKTVRSGSLPANPWGLHEVHGNVWEWVQDCWHDNYNGPPPADGTAWEEADGGECGRRVIRGGSWGSKPRNLLSADRDGDNTDYRFNSLGFRLAQDL